MAKKKTEPGAGPLIRFFLLMSMLALYVAVSAISYSQMGYTLVKHPGIEGGATICIEGEVHPTNQSITLVNDYEVPTERPWVMVNGDQRTLNGTLEGNWTFKTTSLKLGCNEVSYGADAETRFKVHLDYQAHYRPRIKYLEIGNMKVGHNVRYFLATEDWEERPPVMGRINITDITKRLWRDVHYAQFNGSATRFRMEEPGNYRASLQVFDGEVWSDIYEASFQSHVITTDEQVTATVTEEIDDDEPLEYEGWVPTYIEPTEHNSKKTFKRIVNGAYIFTKTVGESAIWLISDLNARYL